LLLAELLGAGAASGVFEDVALTAFFSHELNFQLGNPRSVLHFVNVVPIAGFVQIVVFICCLHYIVGNFMNELRVLFKFDFF
jgi:hypothetical protein